MTAKTRNPHFHLKSPTESFKAYCQHELSKPRPTSATDESLYQQAMALVIETLAAQDQGVSRI